MIYRETVFKFQHAKEKVSAAQKIKKYRKSVPAQLKV